MPNLVDLALAIFVAAIWPAYGHFIEWPKHTKRVQSGDPVARVALYRSWIFQQWVITFAIVAVVLSAGRPVAATLGLTTPTGWRLAVGIAIPVLYGVLILLQRPALAHGSIRARLRKRLEPLVAFVPTHRADWNWFRALSVTAGICEEIMFRGYVVWVLKPWLGLYGAAGLSMVGFGLAHMYQGWKTGKGAFLVGVALGTLALVSGSIIPSIVLHALIDLGSGYMSFKAMSEPAQAPA